MSDKPVEGKPVEGMSFEEAMAALEQVVGALERGEVPLEQSIALYERGAKLKAHCAAKLAEATPHCGRSIWTRPIRRL